MDMQISTYTYTYLYIFPLLIYYLIYELIKVSTFVTNLKQIINNKIKIKVRTFHPEFLIIKS